MSPQQNTDSAVLIPSGLSAKSLTCVRSLGSKGITTVVASDEGAVPAIESRYCDESYSIPHRHDDLVAYKDGLLSIATREDIDTIIPNREEDAFVLSKYRDEFADHVEPIWPSMEKLRSVHDGLRLAEIAQDAGVPTPETRLFSEVDNWDEELIIKPRYSILTSEYVEFLSERECGWRLSPIHPTPGVEPDTTTVDESMRGHDPVVQEYVPIKSEYSFRALYDHGEPVATSLRKQTRGRTYAGGASVYREMIQNSELESLGRTILDELDWHGLATVQFIEDANTGHYSFLEINPRTWTSIPTDVLSGADYPYFFSLLASGKGDEIDPNYELGVGTHLLFGELQYLYSVMTDEFPNADKPTIAEAMWEIGTSIYQQPNFDYLVSDDPKPFFRAIRNVILNY